MQIQGKRIHRLRWVKGLGLKELAEAAGISPNTLSLIESGESKGTPRTAKALALALGVSVLDITVEDDIEDGTGDDGDGDGVVVLGAVGVGLALDELPDDEESMSEKLRDTRRHATS